MQEKSLLKKTWHEYAPFICFFFVFLVYHLLIGPDVNDGVIFADYFQRYGLRGLPEYVRMRWQVWSGRLLIEPLFMVFSGISYWAFKVVDLLFWCLLCLSFTRCFASRGEDYGLSISWLSVLLILQYPLAPMNTAGWIATMINNIWSLTAGCYSILIMLRIRQGRHCSGWKLACALLACLFAASTEQMCIVMLSASLFCLLDALLQRNSWHVFVAFLFVSVLQLTVHAVSPGNTARFAVEIKTWFPEYAAFNLADRMYVGFVHVMNYYMGSLNPLAVIFFVSLGVAMTKRNSGLVMLFMAWLPLAIMLWQPVFARAYPELLKLFGALHTVTFSTGHFNQLYFAVCILFLIVSVADILLCTENFRIGLLLLWIIATGFATAEMMGFSPTVYASGDRTFIFSQFAFAAGTLLLVKQKNMADYKHILLGSLSLLSLLSVADNIWYISRVR